MSLDPGARPSSRAPGRRWVVEVLAVALGAGLVWAAWGGRRPSGRPASVAEAGRQGPAGPRYVGDAACARCHAEIAASYRQHPMGRSLIPIAEAPSWARGEERPRTLFEAQGYQYTAERRGDRTVHRETRRDGQGRVIASVEAEVRYVLGSGARALSFVIDHDGFLFESPITWFAQAKRWDLSPGFEGLYERFERTVIPACLFCHANRVEPVSGTKNRYRPPIFQGHAIGCERCHGPGERHLAHPSGGPDGTPTIVNPRTLEPALREAVCQQCHLIGEKRVARAGHELWDYRPGLPLHRFLTVFVRPPGSSEEHKNGDQVEQMMQSRCYRASGGALGCISCHDPHQLPAPEEKVAYYRGRCLECHAERGCALPAATRRARGPDDSCIECHMPRAGISDIAHTAMTIHSIPRHRDREAAAAPSRAAAPFDPTRLVPFHRDLMDAADRRAARRDLGIALSQMGPRGPSAAVPLLERALAEHPDDLDARESLGFALGAVRDRGEEGLAAFDAVLRRAPDRELSLSGAATLAGWLGHRDQAIDLWRRAIDVDPWQSNYHAVLAHQLVALGRWSEAADASRRALRLNPANLLARVHLVESTFHAESPQRARAEFQTLLEFDPPDREALMRWYSSLR